MRRPFTLNEDGEVSYSPMYPMTSRAEQFTLTLGMINTDGFALESVATTILNNPAQWALIYEASRLAHPAEFASGEDLVVPK